MQIPRNTYKMHQQIASNRSDETGISGTRGLQTQWHKKASVREYTIFHVVTFLSFMEGFADPTSRPLYTCNTSQRI